MKIIEPHDTPYNVSLFQESTEIFGCMGSRILAEGREMYLDVGWLFFRTDVSTTTVLEALHHLERGFETNICFVTLAIDSKDKVLADTLKKNGYEEMTEGKFIKYAEGRAAV